MLPRALLEHPILGVDAHLRSVLQQRVLTLSHAGPLDTATQLRRELRVALIDHKASADEIPARMGMSRRTFRRRLEACGVKFKDILHETRCEFAQQLLANTRLSIGEIATIVGYADPSILTRRFASWTGICPREWRSHRLTASLSG